MEMSSIKDLKAYSPSNISSIFPSLLEIGFVDFFTSYCYGDNCCAGTTTASSPSLSSWEQVWGVLFVYFSYHQHGKYDFFAGGGGGESHW